jgi:ADP-ribose pyrophosphatase YjhB (NUDIX family)
LGESAAEAALRETAEETGVTIELTGLVGIYTDPGHVMAYDDGEIRQQFSICFHAALISVWQGRTTLRSRPCSGWTLPTCRPSRFTHRCGFALMTRSRSTPSPRSSDGSVIARRAHGRISGSRQLHAGRARQLRATLNGYAASVVVCDLEDFAAPGRAFGWSPTRRTCLLPRCCLLWLGRLTSAAQIWFYREPSYDAWLTRAAATYAGSTPVAVCQSHETPSCRRHLSTPLCFKSAALDGRGITRPRMPLELTVVVCGAPRPRRRPSVLQT